MERQHFHGLEDWMFECCESKYSKNAAYIDYSGIM
jgi:hypothetical protein